MVACALLNGQSLLPSAETTLTVPMLYEERLARSVEVQLARAEANAIFKEGRLPEAACAYEAALLNLAEPDPGAPIFANERLAILCNLGLCRLRLADHSGAARCLRECLSLGPACYASAAIAVKAACRLHEACQLLRDKDSARAAAAAARFYLCRALEQGGPTSAYGALAANVAAVLPDPPDPSAVARLLHAVGAAESEADISAVSEALLGEGAARPEDLDDQRMNALCLSVHISAIRPGGWATGLLSRLLEGGTPADALCESGRTALALAANYGRFDLCALLSDAGANARATDGAGLTPLHSAMADLGLAAEREAAGQDCDPPAVCALLLAKGAPVDAVALDGTTALALCERQSEHECAEFCAGLIQDALSARGLGSRPYSYRTELL